MANVIPSKKPDYLTWCETHEPLWDLHSAQIGVTAAQMTSWKALNATNRANFLAAEAARLAAKNATGISDDAFRASRLMAAELVRLIKNKAAVTNDPKVYDYAGIPEPTPPSELPAPGAPTDLRAILNDDGTLTIRWKKNNDKGVNSVVYQISRRTGTTGAMAMVGLTGGTSFVDDECPTPPQSNPVIQYVVQGHRNGTDGAPSAVFSVFMGTGAGGGMMIMRTEEGGVGNTQAMKMAA